MVSGRGAPKIGVDSARIADLLRAGRSWSEIAKETGWTKGTATFHLRPEVVDWSWCEFTLWLANRNSRAGAKKKLARFC
jgi:hypothetical protein